MSAASSVRVLAEDHGDAYSIYQADCVDFAQQMPDNSVDISLYSPPFSGLYIYSDSIADMGNTADDEEFLKQYSFLVREMHRVTRPGRTSVVHCKNLVNYAGRDGMAGLRDFRGDIIRIHQAAGFAYASEVVIWKDPVIEMQRTKAHGLLYKQLRTDSTFSRHGLPEYILLFRKWSKVTPDSLVQPVTHTHEDFNLDQWQKWASPVWMDIRQTNVLNCKIARSEQDEKHICPLQLDVIERCLTLWSNPGDTVFSPFMGVGSEGYQSLKFRRKFIGTELKEGYFKLACDFLRGVEAEGDLFR